MSMQLKLIIRRNIMNNIKKLKDIKDMERYLKEDCYCPGEIYGPDGFFFQIFTIDHDCEYTTKELVWR